MINDSLNKAFLGNLSDMYKNELPEISVSLMYEKECKNKIWKGM